MTPYSLDLWRAGSRAEEQDGVLDGRQHTLKDDDDDEGVDVDVRGQ